jgi:hypothetical protein
VSKYEISDLLAGTVAVITDDGPGSRPLLNRFAEEPMLIVVAP